MPLPPSSIRVLTLASVGFLPLDILSFLNSPLRPGPIFFSSLSGLWQTPHCSNTALPLAASPLPADSITLEPTAKPTHNVSTRNRCIVRIFSRDRLKYFTPAASVSGQLFPRVRNT